VLPFSEFVLLGLDETYVGRYYQFTYCLAQSLNLHTPGEGRLEADDFHNVKADLKSSFWTVCSMRDLQSSIQS